MTERPQKARSFLRCFLSLLWSARAVVGTIALLIVLGSVVFAVEGYDGGKHSFGQALYLGFITALNIGYGDLTPDGFVGSVTAVFLGGLGMIITGIVVAAAIKALERSR
jgi:voltage-gated potassium channel